MAVDDVERRTRLRAAVATYLRHCPQAGDTADGVVASWLAREEFADAPRYIHEVLEAMVASGELEVRQLPDGRALYVRGPALGT